MADIIMNMVGLKKVLPNGKELFNGIHLSFFDGAKIGVVGLNGAGKSTLLRIVAGADKDFLGDLIVRDGVTVGYLAQEPELDPSRTVKGNVELGLGEIGAVMARYEAINAAFAEPMDDDAMTRLIDEQARVQDQIEAADAWDLDSKVELAMEARKASRARRRSRTVESIRPAGRSSNNLRALLHVVQAGQVPPL